MSAAGALSAGAPGTIGVAEPQDVRDGPRGAPARRRRTARRSDDRDLEPDHGPGAQFAHETTPHAFFRRGPQRGSGPQPAGPRVRQRIARPPTVTASAPAPPSPLHPPPPPMRSSLTHGVAGDGGLHHGGGSGERGARQVAPDTRVRRDAPWRHASDPPRLRRSRDPEGPRRASQSGLRADGRSRRSVGPELTPLPLAVEEHMYTPPPPPERSSALESVPDDSSATPGAESHIRRRLSSTARPDRKSVV